MSCININGEVPASYIAFSTTALLSNGQTYSSGVLSLIGWTQVQTDVVSDVTGTLTISFCEDSAGANVLRTLTIPYAPSSGYQTFSAPAFTPYVKYEFTATQAGQTSFYYDTKFLSVPLSGQLLTLDAFISPQMTANVGRNILVGKTQGGNSYQNVNIDAQSDLKVAIGNPSTAFGEIKTSQFTPTVQIDFIYGINTVVTNQITVGSGTVTGADGMVVCSTTANTNSEALLSSARSNKYRPGQGALARFTALFTTGVSGSYQYAGLGFAETAAPLNNGLFFGWQEDSFGITTISDGTPTHIAQADWNVDNMLGAGGASNPSGQTLDPTKGNVYQIQYQWLGFGALYFYIEAQETGELVIVHIIKYANANTVPSLENPSMSLLWAAENTTNNTNIVVKGGSGMVASEGTVRYLGPRHGESSTDTTVTTQIASFTFRNATTYNTVPNGGLVRIRTVTFGSNTGGAGNGITYLRMIKDATLGGTPNFVPHDGATADNGVTITSGQSVVSVDKSGTTVTGGNIEYNAIVAVGNSMAQDITDLDIYLAPGEDLTFAIESTQSATVGVGITWSEDV